MSKGYWATLIRGETYYLGTRRFERGKKQLVSASDKEKLVEHAVDRLTVTDGGYKEVDVRQKFRFEASNEAAPTKVDRAAEFEAMQNKGGVDFEDDDADEDQDDEDPDKKVGKGKQPEKAPRSRSR